jgi:LmbE family N-acetylglucosaminyl deacetylase
MTDAVLCVFPHPNDESFCCAGTIASLRSRGIEVDLVTLTRGEDGILPDGISSPEELGRLREYELRAAACLLGIGMVMQLDFPDGQLGAVPPETLKDCLAERLAAKPYGALISFGPLGLTKHADHTVTHRAAADAVRALNWPGKFVFVAADRDFSNKMRLTGPETVPTHCIPVSPFTGIKLMALACHSSQPDAREYFAAVARGAGREELFHQASPSLHDSPVRADLFGSHDADIAA